MANFNKVMLMGNLTRDPELRYAGGNRNESREGGGAVCKFGLAVNRQWRNQAGEKQEETCFVDIVVFGRQAENCNEYLRKGRPVFVEGRLNFNQWEDRESGQKRSKLEVVGETVQFLGSRDGPGGAGHSGGGGGAQTGGSRNRDEVPAAADNGSSAPARSAKPAESAGDVSFDDIP